MWEIENNGVEETVTGDLRDDTIESILLSENHCARFMTTPATGDQVNVEYFSRSNQTERRPKT